MTESQGGGLSGGEVPGYNTSLGQFMFGYSQGTINYSMAVSSALSGTGIQITGMQYGLQYFNQDYSRGSLSATWTLRGNGNNILESYYHGLGATTEGWTNFDMTKTFTNPYSLANVGNLNFSIAGQDDRFWAGYYGPQVRNPYARLTYGVDQCSTNPLSSPTCSGFSDALASRTATPATTENVTATSPTSTSITGTPSTTGAVSTVALSTTSGTTASTTTRSSATPPRLESIIRAVNEATAATAAATIQQSQEQAQQAERSSLDIAAMSMTPGSSRLGATGSGSDSPALGLTRPGDPVVAARGLSAPVPQDLPTESRPQPRNVQPPTELIGGISVVAFQRSVDISAYTNLVLRDSPFYAPREIYRGQQTVDNVRALRGLGSDRVHQEMVDQQYRR